MKRAGSKRILPICNRNNKEVVFSKYCLLGQFVFQRKSRNYISLDEKSRIVYVGSINKE